MKYLEKILLLRVLVILLGLVFVSACSDSATENSSENTQTNTSDDIEPELLESPTENNEAASDTSYSLEELSENTQTNTANDIEPEISESSTGSNEVDIDISSSLEEADATTSSKDDTNGEQSSVVTTSFYTVADGSLLDSETYKGFIVHRNMCARCHGNYGQGMIGPNLAESLNNLGREEFELIVANGRNAMPPHNTNTQVMEALDNLYSYYKARADGAIGEVRPGRLE